MGKTDLPPKRLHEVLRYDPETGYLHWKTQTHGYHGIIRPGDRAGSVKDGYINVHVDKVLYRAHRLAWYMVTGEWLSPKQDIDHINGDRADNRFANLRLVTRTQNNMNLPVRTDNISGYRGVTLRKDTRKWHARITVAGKIILLGDFIDLEDARAARAKAEELYFGAHSYLNRPTAVATTTNAES